MTNHLGNLLFAGHVFENERFFVFVEGFKLFLFVGDGRVDFGTFFIEIGCNFFLFIY